MEYFPDQPFWDKTITDFESRTFAPNGTVRNNVAAQFYNFTASPDEDQTFVAVPDGTVDIFFRCSDEDPCAKVYGSVLKGKVITLKRNAHYFGVRFFPGAAEQVLGCPLDLFTDQDVLMSDVQKCADELVEKICLADSFNERIALFRDYQNTRSIEHKQVPEIVDWVRERINTTKGSIRISALAEETGYSARYVNKLFNKHIGVSPKFYERVVRFQNSLGLLNSKGKYDFTELALEAGYYDQAHFINEFKEFSLSTPTHITYA